MSSVPASLTYRIDDVEVDTLRNCLRRHGKEIHVRAKTFQILVYLISNRDRLVSKEELLEEFWKDTIVGEDVLAHSIAELRRILNDNPREPLYLKTVPKLGYRFVGDVQEVPSDLIVATEQITTIQVREEYSDESSYWRYSRWALVLGLLTVAVVALVAWNYWRHSSVAREPEWWEVAWWKMNEGSGFKIRDSIHGLTATLPTGVSWTPGVSGSALFFTGRELVVRGKDLEGVMPAKSYPKTLTAWIKTGTSNGDVTRIFTAGDGSRACTFGLLLFESGAPALSLPGCPLLSGKQRIDDDRWRQIAGVFEGDESKRMRLFVDGAERASTEIDARLLSSTKLSTWTIGTGVDGGSTFRGAIDDVRIYERALRPDEIRSLYRCMAGGDDIDLPGGSYYFAPIFGDYIEILPRRPGDRSAGVRNTSTDVSGVMFVRREPDCGLRSIHGADIGQDMNIEVELLLPPGPQGAVIFGGPYFRSRRANPGDGIIGGTSAGFWVYLDSTGQVRVRRLLPSAVLGLSNAPEGFDPGVFHKLEAAVHGGTLEVALDGKPLTFDAAGVQRNVLEIPPLWDTVSPKGYNGGSAGIAFANFRDHGPAGGQQARNIRIKPYRPLRDSSSALQPPF